MNARNFVKCCQASRHFNVCRQEVKRRFCRKYATKSALKRKQLHIPVMTEETLTGLNIQPNSTVIDMTFGSGGHAREILTHHEDCKVIALDRDNMAYQLAQEMANEYR